MSSDSSDVGGQGAHHVMGFAFFFFDKFEINSSLVGSRTQSPLTF
jgi:hypothetical protein